MMAHQGGLVLCGRSKRRGFVALGKLNQACGGAAFVLLLTFMVSVVQAEEAKNSAASSWRIDTEHLFGFVIGTDVGNVGDKELEAEVTSGFGKRPGSYAAFAPSLEYEFVPIANLRLAPSMQYTAFPALIALMTVSKRRLTAFRLMSDIESSIVRARALGSPSTLNRTGASLTRPAGNGLIDMAPTLRSLSIASSSPIGSLRRSICCTSRKLCARTQRARGRATRQPELRPVS
jgi:hypothetical protein